MKKHQAEKYEFLQLTHTVLEYVNLRIVELGLAGIYTLIEATASCALEDNVLAAQLNETLGRIVRKDPIGERYLFQLGWFLKHCEDPGEAKQ